MAQAEFRAPHTFAFAAAFLAAMAASFSIKHGLTDLSISAEAMIILVLGVLWSLMEGAFYALGCAWGGVSRPHKITWALASGVLTALGFVLYMAFDASFPPPSDLEEAKEQYTRGTIGVLYVVLAPVSAGLLCAWLPKRAG